MNFIFISPNFPRIYSHFIKALNDEGINVFGIGDEPYDSLTEELKKNLVEYCYVSDMNNISWMIKTVKYLKDKYGEIDYIESNNEYWMKNDATLREWFDIRNGYRNVDLDVYQTKSGMKQFFENAKVKTARYILVSTLENSLEFVKKVNYPVFAKPDRGVGAAKTYKISNEKELRDFHNEKLEEQYIMEEFINGKIISFDGIANEKSEVVICFKETFPTPIADIVKEDKELYYYAQSSMDDEYRKMGERIVKSFNIKSRCFHIELFQLLENKPGFADKNEIVALEVNLRSPGGNTPDLLNLVSGVDYYQAYAKMISSQIGPLDNSTNLISISANRKSHRTHAHSTEDIQNKYKDNIKTHDFYPEAFRDAMGDEYFFLTFDNKDKLKEFINYFFE